MATGTVKWYDPEKGFGFIAREGSDDLFVHRSALAGDVLGEGDTVEFEVGYGPKGANAESVQILERGVPSARTGGGGGGRRDDRGGGGWGGSGGGGGGGGRSFGGPSVDPETLPLATGVVQRYDPVKGFGFIKPDNGGPDVFVHRSAAPFDGLYEGDRVEYRLGQGQKGPRAEQVRVLGGDDSSAPRGDFDDWDAPPQ